MWSDFIFEVWYDIYVSKLSTYFHFLHSSFDLLVWNLVGSQLILWCLALHSVRIEGQELFPFATRESYLSHRRTGQTQSSFTLHSGPVRSSWLTSCWPPGLLQGRVWPMQSSHFRIGCCLCKWMSTVYKAVDMYLCLIVTKRHGYFSSCNSTSMKANNVYLNLISRLSSILQCSGMTHQTV